MCLLLFIVLLSLSLLLWLADFFAFFLRVASRQLHSPLIYALGSANTYVVKGQLHCPPHPPSARNVIPMSSCNAHIRYPSWARQIILIIHLLHTNVSESMEKPCTCMQFIKIHIFVLQVTHNSVSVLQVT